MPILSSGSNVTLTVAAGQILTVQSDQATFDFENPVGTRVGEYAADTVFGPFASAGSVKIASVQGPLFYELANRPVGSSVPFDPSSVAITGGTIGGARVATSSGGVARKLAVIGDSISADAVQITTTDNTWAQWGYLAWLRRYMGQRIDLPFSRMYAVAGTTIAQVRTSQLPSVVASNADTCIVFCGINSVTGGVSYASMVADYQAMLDALRAAGISVVCFPIRVRNSPVALTAPQSLLVGRFNRWLSAYCKQNGHLCININPTYLDFSTGNAQAAYLRDGTHDNPTSARAMGSLIAGILNARYPLIDDRFGMVGDTYDATNNPGGNLLTNGLLAGTGGTPTNGATGSLATSWGGYRLTNTGTLTVAFSKAADATYPTLENQIITFGGTGDGNGVNLQQTQAVPGNVVVGDQVWIECEMDIASLSAGFQGISLNVTGRDGSFVTYSAGWDGNPTTTNGIYPAMTDTGMVFRTEPITIKTGTTVLDTFLRIDGPTSGAVSGAIKVKRIGCYKVQP